jgi:hypothetical protein
MNELRCADRDVEAGRDKTKSDRCEGHSTGSRSSTGLPEPRTFQL